MTPMIDCTFQLILFFILAGQMASESIATLQLHRPLESQAISQEEMQTPNKVIVNVLSAEDAQGVDSPLALMASNYEIDGQSIHLGNTARLAEVLAERKARSVAEDFFVEIRADSRVSYAYVAPVMAAAAAAGIEKMNLTALLDAGE